MSNATHKRLGDLINLKRGYDLPANQRRPGPYPVISSAGITGYHDEHMAEGQGVVTGRYGTLGEMYYVNGKYWPHNTALYVTTFKGNVPKYIYYLLSCLGRIRTSDKSAVPGVNRNELHEMAVPAIDDKDQQKKIATVLSALDAKIECNNRINAELESMAKALYDYWFVQFEFPDANGKPYKSSGGKMVYNATLGREIPHGWVFGPLSNWIAKDKTGDWGKDMAEGNYTLSVDCIRGTDINGLNGKGAVAAPTRFILEKNRGKILAPFDLVIEISGGSPTQSTGRLALMTSEAIKRFSRPVICSNFCKAISLKNSAYAFNFAYLWKSAYENKVLFGWEGKTSGIKNLLFDAFTTKHMVCMPTQNQAQRYFDFVSSIEDKRQKRLQENESLEALRDWLLPLLMNGQVTVA
jgi:type I restriction enzyme S subunit